MPLAAEDRVLEELKDLREDVGDISQRLARLESKFDERSTSIDVRVTTLERKAWAAVTGLIVGLTSLMATGALSLVNFFTGK